MLEDRHYGLRRWRALLAAIILSFGILAPRCSEAALPPEACRQGYVQHDPVALGCQGGDRHIKFGLTEASTPHHLLLWQAPSGTKNLRVIATLTPPNGGQGDASLKVACSNGGKVLIGSDDGVLNRHVLYKKIGSAHWQWGRDSGAGDGESFEEWFRVNGTLPCDVEVSFSNEHSTRLVGDLRYEWENIDPCPDVPLGCRPCSEEQARCGDQGKIAICDGSPFVECKTKAALKAAEENQRHGCCFTYNIIEKASEHDEGASFLEPRDGMTKGACNEIADLDKRGYVGWNTRCPKDVQEAEMWRKQSGGSLPRPIEVAPTTTTLAPLLARAIATTTTPSAAVFPTTSLVATTTTALAPHLATTSDTTTTPSAAADPTTSLVVALTHELAGAFALELQTSMNVSMPEFHHLLLVALAESISVHTSAFERFKVVAVGDAPARRLEKVDARRIFEAPAPTTAKDAVIIGVGYEVATGSAERQTEIQTRLNNMDGPVSRVRTSLTDILARQLVGLIAVQVTYPASSVSEIGSLLTFPTSTTRSMGHSAVRKEGPAFIPSQWLGGVRKNKPSSIPTNAALGGVSGVVCGLLVICCCCVRVFSRKKPPPSIVDRRADLDAVGLEAGSASAVAPLRRDQFDRSAGYEPVRSQDASFHSVASDSSDAAGLRLLGNDGM